MAVGVLALGAVTGIKADGCAVYPIALHIETLQSAQGGEAVVDIWNGVQPGNFGWMSWNGHPSEQTLQASMQSPQWFTQDFVQSIKDNPPKNAPQGDDCPWFEGIPGVKNSIGIREIMDGLLGQQITVPVWDLSVKTGNNVSYRVVDFASVIIEDYELPKGKVKGNRIRARILGIASCADVTLCGDPIINLPPIAQGDAYSTVEQSVLNFNLSDVLANDSDPDGDVISLVAYETSGVVIINGQSVGSLNHSLSLNSGVFTFDSGDFFDFLGADTSALVVYSYTITDPSGATDQASITVTVNGLNDPPLALNNGFAVIAGATKSFTAAELLANDTDPDVTDVLSIHQVASLGTITVDGSPTTLVAPDLVFSSVTGPYTFTATSAVFDELNQGQIAVITYPYVISDGTDFSTANIVISVSGGSNPPVAVDNDYKVIAGGLVMFTNQDLLANDSDPDLGDVISVVSYSVDGEIYQDGTYIGTLQGALIFDEPSQTYTFVSGSAFNHLTDSESVEVRYHYTISDFVGNHANAQILITVAGGNEPPVAETDYFFTLDGTTPIFENGPLLIFNYSDLLANDSDPDGDDIKVDFVHTTGKIVSITPGSPYTDGLVGNNISGGFFAVNTSTGDVTLDPAAFTYLGEGQVLELHFDYQISDSFGGTDVAKVVIEVTGVNNRPRANEEPLINGQLPSATLFSCSAGFPEVLANGIELVREQDWPIYITFNDTDEDLVDNPETLQVIVIPDSPTSTRSTVGYEPDTGDIFQGDIYYYPGEDSGFYERTDGLWTDSFSYRVMDSAGALSEEVVRFHFTISILPCDR